MASFTVPCPKASSTYIARAGSNAHQVHQQSQNQLSFQYLSNPSHRPSLAFSGFQVSLLLLFFPCKSKFIAKCGTFCCYIEPAYRKYNPFFLSFLLSSLNLFLWACFLSWPFEADLLNNSFNPERKFIWTRIECHHEKIKNWLQKI